MSGNRAAIASVLTATPEGLLPFDSPNSTTIHDFRLVFLGEEARGLLKYSYEFVR